MVLTDDPCDAITGPGAQACDTTGGGSGGGGGDGAGTSPANPLDPLQSLADSFGKAAAWVARKVGSVLDGDLPQVDFASTGFVKQYAVIFAASVFITMLVWLSAVVKRVVRAVPFTTAITESIGLLWLSVIVSAFSPLGLYVAAGAASSIARGLGVAMGVDGSAFEALAAALQEGDFGGGPIMQIVAAALAIVLCGAVLLLMVLRVLALYVGALLGVPIHAGLVDKDLWGHTRKWAAAMAALLAIEPVLVAIVGVSAAVQAEGDVVTGLGVTAIALGAVALMVTRLPAWGDTVKVARQTARAVGTAGGAVFGGAGAAGGVMQGIHTHGGRAPSTSSSPETRSGSSKSSESGVSGGIQAHGTRRDNDQGKGDGGKANGTPKK